MRQPNGRKSGAAGAALGGRGGSARGGHLRPYLRHSTYVCGRFIKLFSFLLRYLAALYAGACMLFTTVFIGSFSLCLATVTTNLCEQWTYRFPGATSGWQKNIMKFTLDICRAGRPSGRLPLDFSEILK
jgi:hypothetical protein